MYKCIVTYISSHGVTSFCNFADVHFPTNRKRMKLVESALGFCSNMHDQRFEATCCRPLQCQSDQVTRFHLFKASDCSASGAASHLHSDDVVGLVVFLTSSRFALSIAVDQPGCRCVHKLGLTLQSLAPGRRLRHEIAHLSLAIRYPALGIAVQMLVRPPVGACPYPFHCTAISGA